MNRPMNRRTFLKLAGASAVAAMGLKAAQGALASAPGSRSALRSAPPASSAHRWVMVIDQDKCVGCGRCTLACRASNDVRPEISWNVVLATGKVGDKDVFLPRPCMHCEHAPCVEVCPVEASYRRPDGIVMMDYDRCIGCRYCEVACPYGARSFNWEAFTGPNPAVPMWGEPEVPRRPRGVPEKCSFCFNRVDRGLELGLTPGVDEEATPACVNVCPMGARAFGDLNDPKSNVSKLLANSPSYRLREDLGTAPHVYYLPARPEATTA